MHFVPPRDPTFADRARAESFGAIAEAYDRYRPSYPDALIEDLVELNPRRTLDIACGTGKVAVPLVACGLAVLGVEVDAKMANVARRHGIIVEVSSFETWDDDGRTFDLITCGQAWHWIDPDKGAAKAARLLNPGGTLALFWNFPEFSGDLRRAIDDVYREHAPDLVATNDTRADERHLEALRSSGLFADIETRTYRWDRTLSAEEWVGRTSTQSDHLRLPDDQRTRLLDALRATIDARGGAIDLHFGTYTIFARTAEQNEP
jgi:SAM-dependent methyltransferase